MLDAIKNNYNYIYIVYSKFKCMKFHVIIFGSKLKFNWNDT